MNRSLSFLLFSSIFSLHAEKSAVSSQFLKLLAPVESIVEKTVGKSEVKATPQPMVKEAEQKNDTGTLNQFLQLLDITQKPHKKLYRADLASFKFKYVDELEYAQDCDGFPTIDQKKLNKAEKENAKKYGKLIAKGYEVPWYLQYIDEQIGHGAFADADIESGQMIGEYTGIIVERNKSKDIDMSYGWMVYAPEDSRDMSTIFFIDARKAGNFTRYINHSAYPNVNPLIVYSGDAWHMIYVANRDIKKDEQLLVNYGAGYWKPKSCKPVEMGL